MVKVLAKSPKVGGVGSALGDIPTGLTWETGANIVRRTGYIKPGVITDKRFYVKADYLAACSGLVRRTAIERTGLFPLNFIYYDDIDWCIQMTVKTGMKIVGAPKSRAYHPPGNRRYITWGRYYIARNCFSHIDAMRLGGWVRFTRAMRELPRAVAQEMMGLDELAQLHIRGLKDALDKRFIDIEPKDVVAPLGFKPFKDLKSLVQSELGAQSKGGTRARLYVHPLPQVPDRRRLRSLPPRSSRLWTLPGQRIGSALDPSHARRSSAAGLCVGAISSCAASLGPPLKLRSCSHGLAFPASWFRGKVLIQVTTEGLLVRRPAPLKTVVNAAKLLMTGLSLAVKIGLRGPHVMTLPAAPAFRPRVKEIAGHGPCQRHRRPCRSGRGPGPACQLKWLRLVPWHSRFP